MILMLCVVGCAEKNGLPSGVLKPEKMQEVFWSMIQAESFTKKFIVIDSLKNAGVENAKLQRQIFAINKITKEEFYKSYNFYSVHIELMRNLLDSISAKAEREKYTLLYSKPAKILPAGISLSSLPEIAPPPFIPMPVPTVNQVPGTFGIQSFLHVPPASSPYKTIIDSANPTKPTAL